MPAGLCQVSAAATQEGWSPEQVGETTREPELERHRGEGRGTAGGSRVKDNEGESWKDGRGGEGRTPESSLGTTARTRVRPVRVAEAERKEASWREGSQKRGAVETRKAGRTLLGWAGAAQSLCIFEGQGK